MVRRKRTPLEIYHRIVEAAKRIYEQGHHDSEGRISNSRLQSDVYISWRRFKKYLADLVDAGLIDGTKLTPTEIGIDFLRECELFEDRLVRRYGLFKNEELMNS